MTARTTARVSLTTIRTGAARYGIVVALLVLVVAVQMHSDTFLTQANLFNIGEQWAPVGVMAVGMTFVLIGGGFDLSVGATFAFSATLAAFIVQDGSTVAAVLIVLALGAVVGVVNGLLVTRVNINALIATLGMAQVVRGLGLVYTDGGTYSTMNGFFSWLGSGSVGEVPVPFLVLVVFGVVLGVVLARSSFGRNVYAVGGNREASFLAGVPVDRVRILTYVISGLCAAVAGMMYLGRVGSAQASTGAGIELQVIAAVLIGGVSIAGGEGAMWRAGVGVAILAVLQNFFNQANVNSFWQSVVQGAIILLAVGLDSYGKRPHRRRSWLRGRFTPAPPPTRARRRRRRLRTSMSLRHRSTPCPSRRVPRVTDETSPGHDQHRDDRPDLLAVGRWLVADPARDEVVAGPVGVLVHGGVVTAIGPPDELRARRPREEVGGPGAGIIPGLVNSHHHQSVTPFQRGVRDDRLEPWLAAQALLPLVDAGLDARWGALDMLRSGITTVVHNHAAAWLPAADPVGAVEGLLDAYAQTGLRGACSVSARDQHPLVYGDDPSFTCGAASASPDRAAFDTATYPDFTRAVVAIGTDPRVRVQASVHNVQWCSDELLVEVRELADAAGIGVHLHAQETRHQLSYGHRQWGSSPLQHLEQLGFLAPDVTCAHVVWSDPGDAELLAGRGVTVVHNPSSNLRLRSGIARVDALRAAGVEVALGLDQAGLDDDQDAYTEMRLALRLAGVVHDGPALDARDVFAMATTAGASTTGFEDAGRVVVDGAADLVVVDLERPSSPWLHPDVAPCDLVVQRIQPVDVVHVVTDGIVRVRDRELVGVDVDGLRDEFAEHLAAGAGADLAGGRALAAEVGRWFDAWAAAPAAPAGRWS